MKLIEVLRLFRALHMVIFNEVAALTPHAAMLRVCKPELPSMYRTSQCG